MAISEHHILNKLSATHLPTISQVLVKLLSLCQDDRASTVELANLIWQEPTMAQKILHIANSSAYAHTGPHVKLESSLIAMGTDMVRMLVINESIFQNLRGLSKNIHLDLRAFWHHSLTTAMLAHNAAKYIGYDRADNAYLTGLLHDIGRLALMTIMPEQYVSLFYKKDDEALCIQESKLMGFTHTEAGAWLIRYWKLEPAIADSVQLHHEAFDRLDEASPLVRVVHLANNLAYCDEESPMVELIGEHYGLDKGAVLDIMKNTHEYVQQAANYLGIDLSDIEPTIEEPAILAHLPEQAAMNKEILSLLNSSEFGRFFIRQTSQPHLQQAAILASCNILRFDRALLFWHNLAEDKYSCIATDTPSQKLLGVSIPAHASSMMNQAAQGEKPVFITSAEEFPMSTEKNLALLIGNTNWIMIPLVDAKRPLGLLFGSLGTEQLKMLKQKKWLIQNFVEQFVLAWHHLEETKRHIQEEVTLIEEKYKHLSRTSTSEAENPLTIVRNYLQLLNKKLENQSSQKNAVTVLKEEIDRLEAIINDMVAPPLETMCADLSAVVPAIVAEFKKTMPAVMVIARNDSPEKKQRVNAPENLLKQVLFNLLRYASAHMNGKKEIVITHQGKKELDGKLFYELTLSYMKKSPEKESLHMPSAAQKEKQKPAMDMSMTYSLLKQVNAWMSTHSDINGSTFVILVPADNPTALKIKI